MSRKEILTCDFCGIEGHDPQEPGIDCIKQLLERIKHLEAKCRELEARPLITFPKSDDWNRESTPAPWSPYKDTIID
jgi:hypothetical protein